MFRVIQQSKGKFCQAHGCRTYKKSKDKFCSKHRSRHNAKTHPIYYTYHKLKSNAKRRGKVFTITLCYFRLWCSFTDCINKKGRSKNKSSIDRIDPNKGYEIGNIQILSVSCNSKKMHTDEELNVLPF